MKGFLILFVLLLCGLESKGQLTHIVMWSFDNLNGTTVIPDYSTDEKYYADLSPLGSNLNEILVPGIEANAVYVNGKAFNLATGLTNECLREPDSCIFDMGSVLSFRLKLESWNNAAAPVIFRTTPEDRSAPGVWLGKGSGDELMIVYRGSDGETYWKTFEQSYVLNKWAHIVFDWNIFGDIDIFINSKLLGKDLEELDGAAMPLGNTTANLVVGSENGPKFYLDQFYVYYGYGSVPDTTPATTTTSTTTTTTTTTPTTSSTTTTKSTTTTPTTTSTTTTPTTTSTTTTSTTTSTTPDTTTTTTTPTTPEQTTTTLSIGKATGHFQPTSDGPSETYWNIWVPILIAFLAIVALSSCLIYLLCVRRRRNSRSIETDGQAVAFSNVKGGYERASGVEPYQDSGSNFDTEDTDAEEHNGRLLSSPQPSAV